MQRKDGFTGGNGSAEGARVSGKMAAERPGMRGGGLAPGPAGFFVCRSQPHGAQSPGFPTSCQRPGLPLPFLPVLISRSARREDALGAGGRGSLWKTSLWMGREWGENE